MPVTRLDLLGLQAKIQLFRCAYRHMDITAREALAYADELGLYDEAQSDMFGDGTPNGIFEKHTNTIRNMIDNYDKEQGDAVDHI